MDQQRRVLIAVALSIGLSFAYSKFILQPQAERAAAEAAANDAGVPLVAAADGGTAPAIAAAPTPVVLEDGGLAEAPAAPVVIPERELKAKRSSMELSFVSRGGGLNGAMLTGERERQTLDLGIVDGWRKLFGAKFDQPPHIDLAQPPPETTPQLGLTIIGGQPLSARTNYAVLEEQPTSVTFQATEGPWLVTKRITWPTDTTGAAAYTFGLEVTVKNVSANDAHGELAVHTTRAINPEHEEAPSLFGGIGNQASVLCRHEDKVLRAPPSEKDTKHEEKGAISFVGIDQQYFLSVIWPLDGAVQGRCDINSSMTVREGLMASELNLRAGESVTKRYGAFLGPKDLGLLSTIAAATPTGLAAGTFEPQLDKTVDFGWWAVLCKPLLGALRTFHGWVGNWGIAIVLLTILVKLMVLPLTHRAMVAGEKMKAVQPRMQAIREKYPDDPTRQMAEMQKLGMNPLDNLTGCLPLLLQIPVWGALFTTLRTSYELYGEPFMGVWTDLTTRDPTYLLPLALGVTMIVTQRLQPTAMMDKQQAFMMTWLMPVFFTGMMMKYPAGLALYIFTNNLLSIVQQFLLRRWLKFRGQAAPTPPKADEKKNEPKRNRAV